MDTRNLGRAALQGLSMGWGDEAEAWLRSKLEGDQGLTYDQQLKDIRDEYGAYAKENPWSSGGAEFAGGAMTAPFIPGGAAKGAAGLARLAGIGAATGAVAGAGSATEGNRGIGATTGAIAGGVMGAAVPLAMRGAGAVYHTARERVAPSQAYINRAAADKMNAALERAGVSRETLQKVMDEDRAMGVPSLLLNASKLKDSPFAAGPLERMARGVAKRGGDGVQDLENKLTKQRYGSRERTYAQAEKQLDPGLYFADLERTKNQMSERAKPLYEKAYEHGEVTDPKVLKYMELPQFQQALGEAKKLLAEEGREMDLSRPTVEVLDQVKRGLDNLIEKETDSVTGKVSNLGRVRIQKKNEFLNALDKAVPDYELARGVYKGGAEIADAMQTGFKDFGRLKPEEVANLVNKYGDSEKEAFRTGVARYIYGQVMDSSGNFNAAQRLIGSPTTQDKMRPLFDSPAKFDLYKAALEREAQLFHTSNRILGGSDTAENTRLIADIEGNPMVNQFFADAARGSWHGAITNTVVDAINQRNMSDKVAGKLAKMLTAQDPHEVAAAVKLLEQSAAAKAPAGLRATGREGAAVSGAASSIFPAPVPSTNSTPSLESALQETEAAAPGMSLEEVLDREEEKARTKPGSAN